MTAPVLATGTRKDNVHTLPRRIAAALGVAAIVLSACGSNSGLRIPSTSGLVVSPFLQGFTAAQAEQYRLWWWKLSDPSQAGNWIEAFNGASGGGTTGGNYPLVDQDCPLHYAYDLNSGSKLGTAPAGSDLLDLADPAGAAETLNADGEALMFLVGTQLSGADIQTYSGRGGTVTVGESGINCVGPDGKPTTNVARPAVYIPVRLALGLKPRVIVDGFAGPATAITVTVDFGPSPTIKLVDGTKPDDSASNLYSISRLRRFVITDANAGRVFNYARIYKNAPFTTPKIFWFRESDFAPFYRSLTTASCLPFIVAWKDGGSCGKTVDISNMSIPNTTWLDQAGTADGAAGVIDGVTTGSVSTGDVNWDNVKKALEAFDSAVTSGGSANRSGLFGAIKSAIGVDALPAYLPPPALVDATGNPQGDVVALLANNGPDAYTASVTYWADKDTTLAAWASTAPPYAVGSSDAVPISSTKTMTITPRSGTLMTDAAAYSRASYLFGDGTTVGVGTDFSTSDADTAGSGGAQLDLQRAPLMRLHISIRDPISQQTGSDYTSDWLPLFALGQLWTPTGDVASCGTLDFGCWVNVIVSNLVMGIYSFTVGWMVDGLASSATGAYLAIPTLEPYVLDRTIVNTSFYKLKPEVLALNYTGTDPDILACRSYEIQKEGAGIDTSKPDEMPACFTPNGTYTLFVLSRGIMMVLLLFYIVRFILALQTGSARELTISAFFARTVIAAAWIILFGSILALLAAGVAEVILITNGIGTLVTGHPYNHLWLFLKFTNPPVTTDWLQALGLMIGACVSILGLIFLVIVTWIRLGVFTFLLVFSPIWMVDLMRSRKPTLFYSGITLFLKLYFVPILTLVVLLLAFILNGWLNSAGLVGAFLSALVFAGMAIGVAFLPLMLANRLVKSWKNTITTRVEGSLMAGSSSELDNMVRAGLAGGGGGNGGIGSGGARSDATLASPSRGSGGGLLGGASVGAMLSGAAGGAAAALGVEALERRQAEGNMGGDFPGEALPPPPSGSLVARLKGGAASAASAGPAAPDSSIAPAIAPAEAAGQLLEPGAKKTLGAGRMSRVGRLAAGMGGAGAGSVAGSLFGDRVGRIATQMTAGGLLAAPGAAKATHAKVKSAAGSSRESIRAVAASAGSTRRATIASMSKAREQLGTTKAGTIATELTAVRSQIAAASAPPGASSAGHPLPLISAEKLASAKVRERELETSLADESRRHRTTPIVERMRHRIEAKRSGRAIAAAEGAHEVASTEVAALAARLSAARDPSEIAIEKELLAEKKQAAEAAAAALATTKVRHEARAQLEPIIERARSATDIARETARVEAAARAHRDLLKKREEVSRKIVRHRAELEVAETSLSTAKGISIDLWRRKRDEAARQIGSLEREAGVHDQAIVRSRAELGELGIDPDK